MATEQAPMRDVEKAQPDYGTIRSTPAKGMQGVKNTRNEPDTQHTFLYSMLRRHSHRWYARYYRIFMRTLVAITVINFILESEKFFVWCCTSYFNIFEGFVSTVCLLDYCAKIWTVGERRAQVRDAPKYFPVLNFIFTQESLIDVICFLPFFVDVIMGVNPARSELIRILRLVRLLKLPILWDAFRMIERVFYFNSRILCSSLVVCFVMLLTCSIFLYYNRPVPNDPKENFHSILACFYLAVLMLTGQGIPDGILPWYTRVVVAITAIFAIAQFAIPASMLTWGFEQEAERNINKHAERQRKEAEKVLKGRSMPESSSSSGESDRKEDWDGYLEQVLGSDAEDSDSEKGSQKSDEKAKQEEAKKAMNEAQQLLFSHARLTETEVKRAKRIFVKLDTDGDGLIEQKHIREITESDQEAEDLLEKLRKFASGDEVNMHVFLLWLSSVKTQYHRYGDKVFLRLLHQMEVKLLKTAPTWKRAANAITLAGRIAGRKATGQTSSQPASPAAAAIKKSRQGVHDSHQQMMQFADRFGELERINKELQAKAAKLEAEIARVKGEKEA